MHNIRNIVRGIIEYYNYSKGVGHTRLAYEGLQNTPNAKIVLPDIQQTNRAIQGVHLNDILTLEHFDHSKNKLRGIKSPIVFDNHTIDIIMRYVDDEFRALNSDLSAPQEELKNVRVEYSKLESEFNNLRHQFDRLHKENKQLEKLLENLSKTVEIHQKKN